MDLSDPVLAFLDLFTSNEKAKVIEAYISSERERALSIGWVLA